MRSLIDMWVVNTCLHLMLHHTENMKFHLEQNQLKRIKSASLPCSPLCSLSLGLSCEPKVFHTSLSQYEILKVHKM